MEHTVDNLTKKELAEHLNEEFKEAILPVTIFMGFECVLGFFGNLTVLYVFLFHYHVCTFRYFVLSLAFVDILSTLITMPGEIFTQLNWYVYTEREVCKVKSFFNVFTISAEALCLLTIVFDRYRKVCKPFGWQIKPSSSISICCVIYFISFLISLPDPFLWGLQYYQVEYENTVITVTICEKEERFKNTIYPLVYAFALGTIMSLCCLVMLVLYFLVAKTVIRQKQKVKNSRSPIVVGTEQLSNNATSPDYSAGMASFMGESGYSITTANAYGIKNDVVSSDDESETQKAGSNLKVSSKSSRNETPLHNVEKEVSRGKPRKPREEKTISERVQRKTLIIFILTLAFIATMFLYLTLLSFIAESENILHKMDTSGKAAYFFFFRLYFLNHVINPVVYGVLDLRFRKGIRKAVSTNRLRR